MKNYNKIKTIQLIIYTLLTISGLALIFLKTSLFQSVGTNPDLMILCILLWISFGLSFVFIYLDYKHLSSARNDYSELDYAVHTDNMAGIANRYSCDAIIEKYADKPLPAHIGSIMFDITNIQKINKELGHTVGNTVIRDFSGLMKLSAFNYCFVGRNGGNKFLALFEDSTEEKMNTFLKRVQEKVDEYNQSNPKCPIEYRWGMAYHDNDSIQSITELIALSNKKIYED